MLRTSTPIHLCSFSSAACSVLAVLVFCRRASIKSLKLLQAPYIPFSEAWGEKRVLMYSKELCPLFWKSTHNWSVFFFTFSNKWKPKLSVIHSGKSQTTVKFCGLSWPSISVRAALTSCEHSTVQMCLEVLNLSAAFQPCFTEMEHVLAEICIGKYLWHTDDHEVFV